LGLRPADPPILVNVVRDGKKIPAVGIMSKMAMLFILDRVTGKPIYGVEERPVPKGDLAGEYYSPTRKSGRSTLTASKKRRI